MKNRPQSPKNNFTWGIRSSDIGFMRLNPGEAVLEGSSTSTDCGCGVARFTVKKPPQQARRRNGQPGES